MPTFRLEDCGFNSQSVHTFIKLILSVLLLGAQY